VHGAPDGVCGDARVGIELRRSGRDTEGPHGRIDRHTLEAWRAEATRRSLYVLDVRTPEEYEAGHLRGARLAPGGQLVQETDSHMATWGARVVLVDDNGVRATMTASWLKQMGWRDVAVLVCGPGDGQWTTGRHVPRVLGLEGVAVPGIAAMDLRDRLATGAVVAIDLELSRRHAQGHIPGSWFAIRSRLLGGLAKLPAGRPIVLTSSDGALAQLAAAELMSRPTFAAAASPVAAVLGSPMLAASITSRPKPSLISCAAATSAPAATR